MLLPTDFIVRKRTKEASTCTPNHDSAAKRYLLTENECLPDQLCIGVEENCKNLDYLIDIEFFFFFFWVGFDIEIELLSDN